ncbi:MAG TPA: HAD-IIIA family hydrolase [Candidatus Limnocylindrales bacterium]|nr:HAD-IIIA family hydrolase [Candidatus Limnocylindrales bacterium]
MRGIVFLDRDGTLIEEMGYLSDPALLREIPGAAESLGRLTREGYALAVVSNQAGLAKGRFRDDQMESVHRAFVDYFRARGIEFAAVEYCPHHPEGVVDRYRKVCGCRKPAIGMAEKVLLRLGAPASCRMWVVGDKMSDILMGKQLRAETILVATGYGEEALRESDRLGERPDRFLPSIREAAEWIVSRGKVQ